MKKEEQKKYVTQFGKGIFKGLEPVTNRLLIDITEPNERGKMWIFIHRGNSIGAFTEFEVQKLLFN